MDNESIRRPPTKSQRKLHSESMSAHTPTDDARQIIDQDIRKLEASIVDLKVRRNTFAPIYQLPPEILCRIFAFVREIWEMGPYRIGWTHVTHVCQHWRFVAINAPILWTKPQLSLAKWTTEMLRRSQLAGLILVIYSDNLPKATISSALQHISHVKDLTLRDISSSNLRAWLSDLPIDPTPQLQSISINYPPTTRHREPVTRDGTQFLPKTIFRGANRLRCLKLWKVNIEWDSHLPNGLTELALCDISLDARPTWSQLVSVFQQLPNLESLDLRRALPTRNTPCKEIIHLTCLQILVIDSPALEVELFFRHISIPRLKKINVGSHSTEASYSGVISALCQSCLTESLGTNVQSLNIHQRIDVTYGLCFEAFNDCTHLRTTKPAVSELELLFGPPVGPTLNSGPDHFNNRIVKDFVTGLNLVNLQELILDEAIEINSMTLANTFGKLPQLHSVILCDSTAKAFIEALQVQSHSRGDAFLSFPGLWSIKMDGVSFHPDNTEDLQVEELEDCLMNRYEHGAEIRELHLFSCLRLTESDVSSLEDIVVDVHWDGEELGFTSDEEEEEEYDVERYRDGDFDLYDLYDHWR